ncbi:MAG: DUF481 domain-containing protein [Bryobacteraceae bacterium]|nr:DUF481 domain-containing protein [Bryobacteraceae bacterium]
MLNASSSRNTGSTPKPSDMYLLRSPKFAFLLLVSAAALWSADQVHMKNGDRVTGSIIKKDAKTLTIKTDLFGTVTLPWDQVDTIKADQVLNVVLPEGKTVKAKLDTQEGKVAVATTDPNVPATSVEPAAIVALRNDAEQKSYERLLAPRLIDLWAGNATIGWAGTKGNAETQTFTVGMTATRVTNTDKMTVYFNAIRANAEVNRIAARTAQAIRGGWGYNRNLSKRVFINTFNDYEYDRFQNLDLRFVLGGGLGYAAWQSERGRLDVVGGAAYNREKFDPIRPQQPFVRNSAEAYWGNDFRYRLNARTNLTQSFRMFNNLSNTGNYRVNFDTGATTQVFKWLTWNIAISNRFLSNPVPGRQQNDFLYTTGFGISFAR